MRSHPWAWAAATAVLMLLGTATSAGAAFPGENGRILFATDREASNQGFRLYTMEPDGSDQRRIVYCGATCPPPARGPARWSPDGRKIAFDMDFGAIWVVDADGSDLTPLASDADGFPMFYPGGTGGHARSPAWSPDGTRIAFRGSPNCVRNCRSANLYTMNADGTNIEQLVPDVDAEPAWSPDGTEIAYAEDGIRLVAVQVADPASKRVIYTSPCGVRRPDWKPDGQELVFSEYVPDAGYGTSCSGFPGPPGRDQVVAVDADGSGGRRQLTAGAADGYDAVWSPDGTKIAFTTERDDVGFCDFVCDLEIYVMDADGGNQHNISNSAPHGPWFGTEFDARPDWGVVPPPAGADADGDFVADDIDSGDGAFTDLIDGGTATTGSIISVDPGVTVTITDAPDPDGVSVVVTGASGRVSLSLCGFPGVVRVAAGSTVVLSCGSIRAQVLSGAAEIVLNDGETVVSIPAGVTGRVSQVGDSGFAVEALAGGDVTVTTGGVPATVPAGGSLVVDKTAPVVIPTVTGTLGSGDWYVGDVGVSWAVSDPESDVIAQDGCSTATVDGDTAGVTLTCSATSPGGTTTESVLIKRDASAPTVAFAEHPAAYTVEQTVVIPCTAFDDTSGIATDCQGVDAAAHTFGLGPETVSTSATDTAGNSRTVSTSFTVQVTGGSLCALTGDFVHGSASYQNGSRAQKAVASAAVAAACGAVLTIRPGTPERAKAAHLEVYRGAVERLVLRGNLTEAQAQTLNAFASAL